MTIARPIHERAVPLTNPYPGNENAPMRYPVMVRKTKGGNLGEYLVGHIVTHLAVRDYCEMHGLYLQDQFPGKRAALPGEKTELF